MYAGGNRVAKIVENSRSGGNEGVLSQVQHLLDSKLDRAKSNFDLLAPTSSSLPTDTMDNVAEYDFESSYGNWLPNVED